MKKLEVTLEILETKELTTIATIVDKSGTINNNGDGNTIILAAAAVVKSKGIEGTISLVIC